MSKSETILIAAIEKSAPALVEARDEATMRAAIASTWSTGQTEWQITKLKLVKRQMYGGTKIDLLEARLIGAN